MEFEFDPKKDEANRRQHGVSLALARDLDWNAMLVSVDDASDPNEERWIGIAPKADRLYVAVYTVRDEDTMRIISLRPATNTEIRGYEQQQGRKQGRVQAKHRRQRGTRQGRHKG